MSLNGYLNTLQNDLYVNGTEKDKIMRSIDAIKARLSSYFGINKKCEHNIIKKEIFGSYSRDTMISRKFNEKSDIDYMIVFEDVDEYNPQTCLNWLKGFAEYWYPNSIVRQSLPTIVIELENIKFELVPAYEKYGMKYVAWDSSNWHYTDTDSLKDEMLDLNKKTNFEFKRIVRAIKYWNIKKNYRKYSSFELETFLTDKFKYYYMNCNSAIDYLDWGFHFLKSYKYIDNYVTGRIDNANKYITEARLLEARGDIALAEEKIRKIFE